MSPRTTGLAALGGVIEARIGENDYEPFCSKERHTGEEMSKDVFSVDEDMCARCADEFLPCEDLQQGGFSRCMR
jgi:hypothetical protein